MNELRVEFDLPTPVAEACRQAVGLEAFHEGSKRSDVGFSCSVDQLKMVIVAGDLSSLRASMNTYIRLIMVCSGVLSRD